MPNYSNITQIPAPRVELIDPRTGLMSREWFRFFNNIYTIVGSNLGVIQIPNGGTGLSASPSNGQLLIGNNNTYSLNTLTAGLGIGVVNGPGTIKITNTGLLSVAAGVGISIITVDGVSTIDNSGVLSFSGGTTGLTPSVATTGAVTLAGTLIAANGGTGYASYTAGDLLYADTSTTLAKLAGGVANNGKFLSIVAGVPAWTTNGSGDVVGPASATDKALARFDTTTGKLIQNSVGILTDAGVLSGLTGLSSTSITDSGLTSGRIIYAGTGGLLQDDADFTFNGTAVTLAGQLNLTNASDYNLYASGAGSNYMAGKLGIGAVPSATTNLILNRDITGGVTAYNTYAGPTIKSDVTTLASNFLSIALTEAAAFTLTSFRHYDCVSPSIGASSAITTQVGYYARALSGATNNYGFQGVLTAATGRYNLYMSGSAANYFAGDMQVNKTVTAAGTTGAQTINKTAGTVNFAAAAASLVVTNSLVATTSIIIATVGTNDTTMKSVSAVAAAGSFTLYANAAATAETRVNFMVFN